MPRVKRGTVRRAKRKKLLARAKGFYQTKSKLYRAAKESVDTAAKYAYVGRKNKKREYRRLWVVRINAAARENGTHLLAADARPQGGRQSRSTARCWRTWPPRSPRRSPRWPRRPRPRFPLRRARDPSTIQLHMQPRPVLRSCRCGSCHGYNSHRCLSPRSTASYRSAARSFRARLASARPTRRSRRSPTSSSAASPDRSPRCSRTLGVAARRGAARVRRSSSTR